MKILKALMIFAAAVFLLSACEYEWIEIEVEVPDVVSFTDHVMPIFENDCVSCHGPSGSAPDLSAEAAYNSLISGNYVNLDNPSASLIYTSMTTGTMKDYATLGTPEIILRWIEQGANDN